MLGEEGRRVVIFMDDIDRLDKSEVTAVFRLVKLSASFTNIAYVLAFDPDRVASALAEQYPGYGTDAGRSFLEKIVQVPLNLPKADPLVLKRICFEGVDQALRLAGIELTEDDVNRFAYLFQEALQVRLRTPRVGRRYGNLLSFALPLVKSEVNIGDFLLIEGVKAFYPDSYSIIRDNRDRVLNYHRGPGPDTSRSETVEAIFDGLSAREAEGLRTLLSALLPRTVADGYGVNWEKSWASEKRLASWQYFDRYFSYTVNEDDFPDSVVEEVLDGATSANDASAKLEAALTDQNAERLLTKLDIRADDLPPEKAKVIVGALAKISRAFPSPKPTLFGNIWRSVGFVIEKCLRRQPDNERADLALSFIRDAASLQLAVLCAQLFRFREAAGEPRLLEEDAESKVIEATLARVRSDAEAAGEPMYKRYEHDARDILWFWAHYGSKEETSGYILKSIDDPKNAADLLQAYTTTVWGGELGLPYKDDFEERDYHKLADVVDLDALVIRLAQIYRGLGEPRYRDFHGLRLDERVANQLAYLHRQQMQAGQESDQSQTSAED